MPNLQHYPSKTPTPTPTATKTPHPSPSPTPGFPAVYNVSELYHDKKGFVIKGVNPGDSTGAWISNVGDIGNYGFNALGIGAPNGNFGTGIVFVVYGNGKGYNATLDLQNLKSSEGFVIGGATSGSQLGYNLYGLGDVNLDGIPDFAVSAPRNNPPAGPGGYGDGKVYVVFGQQGGFPNGVNLNELDGTNGFSMTYGSSGSQLAVGAVAITSFVGDVNGDGINDVLTSSAVLGKLFIIYGSPNGFPANIDLSTLTPDQGATINVGPGMWYAGGANINGDGVKDIITTSIQINAATVVFGNRENNFPSYAFNVSGTDGFVINGTRIPFSGQYSGFSPISAIGDFIGEDGLSDIITVMTTANNISQAFIIKDNEYGFPSQLYLVSLTEEYGFKLNPPSALEAFGLANGIGKFKSGIGDSFAIQMGTQKVGVLYPNNNFTENVDVENFLDGKRGFAVVGISNVGFITGINNFREGCSDLVIGDPGADSVYYLYGECVSQEDIAV
jgi:hypothetical protein